MTPEKPRRFRIHLSTCVILMFVVGGILWANLTPSYGRDEPSGRADVKLREETWGWPVAAYGRNMLESDKGEIHRPPAHWLGDPSFGTFCAGNNNYDAVVFDVFVAILIVGGVAWASEYFVRRREERGN